MVAHVQSGLGYLHFSLNLDYSRTALNKDTFGTSRFVLSREVILFQR